MKRLRERFRFTGPVVPGAALCTAAVVALAAPATRWSEPIPEPVRTAVVAAMFLAGLALMVIPILRSQPKEEEEDEAEP